MQDNKMRDHSARATKKEMLQTFRLKAFLPAANISDVSSPTAPTPFTFANTAIAASRHIISADVPGAYQKADL